MDSASEANVILRGGPSSIGWHERVRFVGNIQDKVKVFLGNRYEHFEPTAKTEHYLGLNLLVYRWTGSTYVAE